MLLLFNLLKLNESFAIPLQRLISPLYFLKYYSDYCRGGDESGYELASVTELKKLCIAFFTDELMSVAMRGGMTSTVQVTSEIASGAAITLAEHFEG